MLAPLANDGDPDGDALTIVSASAANGSVTINADGTLTYTGNPDFTGADTITYAISDGQGGSSTAVIVVNVVPINDAPDVGALADRSDSDGSAVLLPVAPAFSDRDGDTLTFAVTGLPAGLAIDRATGVISGTLSSAASAQNGGFYTVTVTATDLAGLSASVRFSWTVTNPLPTAVNDSLAATEDTPVTIDVLANDTDPDGDRLTIVAASALNGTVVVNADGTITYTPAADAAGADTITYTISDGQGGLSTASVAVTIAAANDTPGATPLPARSDAEGETVSFDAGASFADRDGDPLIFTATGLPPGLSIDPATGLITGLIDRSASRANGGIYTVTITAADPAGAAISGSFVWSVANPTPVANDDVFTTQEDGPITVTVLANDFDPDGDPITIIAASALRGAVTINPDGTLTYTPGPDFNGADVISYTISDGQNGAATATGTATIISLNDAPAPVGTLPQRTDNEGEAISLPIASAFADVDRDGLTFSATGLPAGLSIDTVTGVISGAIAADASATFGGSYTVVIVATDPSGERAIQTFTWIVANPAPVAIDDAVTTAEDAPLLISPLGNDVDPDGDAVTITTASAVTGSVTVGTDGTLTYTPGADFVGTDTITYTVEDAQGAASSATITVTVTPANDAPATAGLPQRSNTDGSTIQLRTAPAFSDTDGDALTFAAAGLPAGLSIDAASGIISGTIDAGASGVNGGAYVVTVTAFDTSGASASTSFAWTITNVAPTATPGTVTVSEDATVVIPVLANVADLDGDALTLVAVSADRGTVVVNPDGTVSYTPGADFNGADTITYVVSDGQGGSTTGSIAVTVSPVNDPPVAASLPNLFDSNAAAVTIPFAPAFSDPDGGALTFSASGLPAGLAIDPATGTITGTIAANASTANGGVYTVTIAASDGSGGAASRSFTWTITNNPPLAADDVAQTSEDTPVTIAVTANDLDPDGDAATPIAIAVDAVTNGSAAVNPDGTITFIPAANFVGVATITYRIDDGLGGSSTATVTITVAPANDAPTTSGIAPITASDGQAIRIPVASAFDDAEGDALTFAAAGLPAGLAIDPATGLISGTIAANASAAGVYPVTITATDPSGAFVSTSFNLTVSNPAPSAVNDTAITGEDAPIVVAVLANDADTDGDPLTIVAADAAQGSVAINPDGTLTYTPLADFTGTDTITYTIADGQGGTATATVSVTVTAGNDAPTAAPIPAQAANDGEAVSLALADAFADGDGDAVTFSAIGLPPGLAIDRATGMVSGTIAATASQAQGGVYTATITATDPSGASASTSVTWTIANVAPIAADDTASAAEGGTITIPVLANDGDGDGDGDPLTIVSAVAARGAVSINPDGTLTYVAVAGFAGVDTITYSISDGQGGLSTGTITVTVAGVNDAPASVALPPRTDLAGEAITLPIAPAFADADGDALAFAATGLPPGLTIDPATGVISGTIAAGASGVNGGMYTVTITATDPAGASATTSFTWMIDNVPPIATSDRATVGEDATVVIPVLANDASRDGDPLTIIAASAGRGIVAINPDGTISYTPPADFTGTDTVSYTISDGQGATSTATVTVTVVDANDAPIAAALPPRFDTDGEAVRLDLAPAFSDPDGDPLVFAATGLPPGLSIDPATGLVTGTVAPDASAGGTYIVTITATDPAGVSGSASFAWTIADAQTNAIDDAATTPEDTAVTIAVLANDLNPDGDALTITSAIAANGTVTINRDGTITYAPAADFIGTDTVTYSVIDGQGGVSTATVTITVTAINDAPDAAPLPDRSDADGEAVDLPLAPAFGDRDGDPLVFSATGLPPGLTIDPGNGRVSGRLATDASSLSDGVYTVVVTATDSAGASVSMSFTWTISNPAPIAAFDDAATPQDAPVTIAPLANDGDPDGDPLTIIAANAANGTVTLNPDGTITYAPAAGFSGTDAITYTVSDGQGGTATASITVTVSARGNTAPVAGNDAAATQQGTPVTITPLGNDSDPDGDPLTIIAASAANGTVTLNPDGTITYAPATGFSGTDAITYTISDGQGGTATASITIAVTAIGNTAPVAQDDVASTREDQPVTFAPRANDSDPDGDPLAILAASATSGTVTINPDGTLTYTPAADFNGTDTISYAVSDGRGGSATATATITVAAANDTPVANNDTAVLAEDQAISVSVLANDRDVDGDPLVVTAARATNGAVTINPDGTLTYTPRRDFTGTDVIAYTVSDGRGGTATAQLTVAVAPVQDAPVDVGETAETSAGRPLTIDVLANANDADGDALSVVGASADAGTVTINPDGTLTYTPAEDFAGAATVTYRISDRRGNETVSTLTITVTPTDRATADVSQLLAFGQINFPDRLPFPQLRSADPIFIAVDPFLLRSLNSYQPLGGLPDLGGEQPLLTAVNALQPLNGLGTLDVDGTPIAAEVARIEARTDLRYGADRLFDRRFGDVAVQGFTGFSTRLQDSGEVLVESVVRNRTIYVEVRESDERAPPFARHQLRMADGARVPEWIRFDSRGLAIVESPVGVDEIRIILRSIRDDGSYVDTPVTIQTATGEIQMTEPTTRPDAAAMRLDEAALAMTSAADREAARLATAFE